MLVKLTQDLKNGFGPLKQMLLANGHKLKEHGMTCIFAATEKDNDNKLTVILDFATPEGMTVSYTHLTLPTNREV